jgi:cytochrome c peroxidase
MPLFNGTVPPHYLKMEFEVIGTPMRSKPPFIIDSDEGKFRQTDAAIHRYAFKTPTVRNIAQTAPYMHNGVYRTLEEVIDFYDKGGGTGLGISLSNQTLPAEPLHLSTEEKTAIIEFLKSLSDSH